MQPEQIDALAWDKQSGLLPAIVQDADTLRVLMLGYMDRAALQTTLDTRRVTFFSRSKDRLWTKGEQSGHFLQLVSIEGDCDNDTLLVLAHPQGPTCHLQRTSCFEQAPGNFLTELDALVAERERERREQLVVGPAGHATGANHAEDMRGATKRLTEIRRSGQRERWCGAASPRWPSRPTPFPSPRWRSSTR